MSNIGWKLENKYNNDVDAFIAGEMTDTPAKISKPGKEKMVLYHQKVVFGKDAAAIRRKLVKLVANPAV
jgi:hypothetical protein